jgi:hypothetical protein
MLPHANSFEAVTKHMLLPQMIIGAPALLQLLSVLHLRATLPFGNRRSAVSAAVATGSCPAAPTAQPHAAPQQQLQQLLLQQHHTVTSNSRR